MADDLDLAKVRLTEAGRNALRHILGSPAAVGTDEELRERIKRASDTFGAEAIENLSAFLATVPADPNAAQKWAQRTKGSVT